MNLGNLSANLRAQLSKIVDDVGTTKLFLLLVLAMITLYPLLFVGFTTHDDVFLRSTHGQLTFGKPPKS